MRRAVLKRGPSPRCSAAKRTECRTYSSQTVAYSVSVARPGWTIARHADSTRLDAIMGNRSQTAPLPLPQSLSLLFFLSFPQGICFFGCRCRCRCFSFCHSRRESASSVFVAVVVACSRRHPEQSEGPPYFLAMRPKPRSAVPLATAERGRTDVQIQDCASPTHWPAHSRDEAVESA